MAEYIDIDKIEYKQGVVLLDSMPIIRKVVTIDDIRDWIPKADVVERSKIYKAFSEIEKLVTESIREALCLEENYRNGLMKAIEIIERNIGDEE